MSTIGFMFNVYYSKQKGDLTGEDYKNKAIYLGKYGMKLPEYISSVCDGVPDSQYYTKDANGISRTYLHKGRYQWLEVTDLTGLKLGKEGDTILPTPIMSGCVDAWEDLSTYVLASSYSDPINSGYYVTDKIFNNHVNIGTYSSIGDDINRNDYIYLRLDNGNSYALITMATKPNQELTDNNITITEFYNNNKIMGTVNDVMGWSSPNVNSAARYAYTYAHENWGTDNARIRVYAYCYDKNLSSTRYKTYLAGDILENFKDDAKIITEWFKTLTQDKLGSKAIKFTGSIKVQQYDAEPIELHMGTYASGNIYKLCHDNTFNKALVSDRFRSPVYKLSNLNSNELDQYKQIMQTIARNGTTIGTNGGISGTPIGTVQSILNTYTIQHGAGSSLSLPQSDLILNGYGKIVTKRDTPNKYHLYYNNTDDVHTDEGYNRGTSYGFIPFIPLPRFGGDVINSLLVRHNVLNDNEAITEYTDVIPLIPAVSSANAEFSVLTDIGDVGASTLITWLWLAHLTPAQYFDEKISPTPEPEPPTPGGGGDLDPDKPIRPNPEPDPDNPFDEIGDGEFAGDNPLPPLPSSDANTDMVTIYTPTLAQIRQLADYLHDKGLSDIPDALVKFFGNIKDVIISLGQVPFNVPSSTLNSVKIGLVDSGINMNVADNQFIELDLGTVNINNSVPKVAQLDNFLRKSPYSSVDLYLPFVGTVSLDPDIVLLPSSNTRIVYRCDIASGACTANILINGSLVYQFSGNVLRGIPITSSDMSNIWGNSIPALAGLAAGGLTGGFAAGAVNAAVGIASNVGSIKPNVSTSGSSQGNSGYLGGLDPYFIIRTPAVSVPNNFASMKGYRSNAGVYLGNVHGYTMVEDVRFNNFNGTDDELIEIKQLLRSGVIL